VNLAQHIVAKTAEDERQALSIGVVAARRVSAELKAKVLQAYVRGETLFIRDMVIRGLMPTVIDTMALMHLKGERMARQLHRLAPSRGLQLSTVNKFERLLKPLANPRELARLRAKYQADALKVLDAAGQKTEKELRKTVTDLIAEGVPTNKGVKVLSGKFEDLGLTPKSGFQLETIYRTQSQIAYGAGRWEADQDPDIQEILWGYEYNTVGDDRVRPEHEALHGSKLPKDDPFWQSFWPPNGYNCRCVAIPLFDAVQIQRPPRFVPGTEDPVVPDKGFAFNAGIVLTER
jgi:SPP1 gp7 family putative phage head morphogenesis protein